MGTTGLIFGVLVAAWLAYLVPSYLNRRDQSSIDVEHTLNFTDDAKLLRLSETSDPVQPTAEVSTPLLRAALRRELHVRSLRAARRRTRLLLLLVLTVVLLAVTTAVGLTRWWTVAAAGAALVVWLFASRWSTARMYRRLDAELADVELSDDEETIAIALPTVGLDDDDLLAEHELSIEISGPVPTMSLWDPIPVTPITYVSRPLTPRTVRTIDLSAPAAPPAVVPVTADAGLENEVREHRRASGE
jgi:hypothetical protein